MWPEFNIYIAKKKNMHELKFLNIESLAQATLFEIKSSYIECVWSIISRDWCPEKLFFAFLKTNVNEKVANIHLETLGKK